MGEVVLKYMCSYLVLAAGVQFLFVTTHRFSLTNISHTHRSISFAKRALFHVLKSGFHLRLGYHAGQSAGGR